MSSGSPSLPLSGISVVEIGTGYVAPLAAMYLRFLGASVIKVENRANPDFMRGDLRKGPGLAPSFIDANRGKKSVSINAKAPAGRELIRQLIMRADIFLENLGAGVIERLGFGYTALAETHGQLIMLSLQGLGANVRNSTTLGQNLPPLIGLTHLWNHAGVVKPVGSQLFHPDYFAGVYSAVLALAALEHRGRSGRGCFIDCAQAEVAASLLAPSYLDSAVNAGGPRAIGNQDPTSVPSGCYPCDEGGSWIYINARDDDQWSRLETLLARSGRPFDAKYRSLLHRLRHRAGIDRVMRDWTRRQDGRSLQAQLKSSRIDSEFVQVPDDLKGDPRFAYGDFTRRLEHAGFPLIEVPGMPLRLSGAEADDGHLCPGYAEHTRDVLRDLLNCSEEVIAGLIGDGVIEG